jgi:hypothetical protein
VVSCSRWSATSGFDAHFAVNEKAHREQARSHKG